VYGKASARCVEGGGGGPAFSPEKSRRAESPPVVEKGGSASRGGGRVTPGAEGGEKSLKEKRPSLPEKRKRPGRIRKKGKKGASDGGGKKGRDFPSAMKKGMSLRKLVRKRDWTHDRDKGRHSTRFSGGGEGSPSAKKGGMPCVESETRGKKKGGDGDPLAGGNL